MEMASCTKASVGTSLSSPYRLRSTGSSGNGHCLPSSPSFRSLQVFAKQCKFNPLCNCAADRNPSSSKFDSSARRVFSNPSSSIRRGETKPSSSIRRGTFPCYAVDGNSTTSSSTTADADPSSPDTEQDGDHVAEYEEPDSVGKALSEIRQERLVSGEENPSKTEEFWRGVLEETRLIEWPSLQKVLGTTGVVTGIIIGSSLVLLTVNALLAQLSDAVFNNVPPA